VSPIFNPSAYCGYEIQNDYFWYLVNGIKRRHGRDWQIVAGKLAGTVIPVDFLNEQVISKQLRSFS
jgi:hypothetical protein